MVCVSQATPYAGTERLDESPFFLQQLRLDLAERDFPNAEVLRGGIAVGVVALVGGGGEDGVAGGEGDEAGGARPVCPVPLLVM